MTAKDLSRDHKPDDADEMARIKQWGGFVSPAPDPGLSARVYLDAEFTMIGLAMSRSIGTELSISLYVFTLCFDEITHPFFVFFLSYLAGLFDVFYASCTHLSCVRYVLAPVNAFIYQIFFSVYPFFPIFLSPQSLHSTNCRI